MYVDAYFVLCTMKAVYFYLIITYVCHYDLSKRVFTLSYDACLHNEKELLRKCDGIVFYNKLQCCICICIILLGKDVARCSYHMEASYKNKIIDNHEKHRNQS